MYDHYIAVDWAQSNMAIGRMTKESPQVKVIDVPADLKEFPHASSGTGSHRAFIESECRTKLSINFHRLLSAGIKKKWIPDYYIRG